ncbi:MAG: efflux RND transporter periplasmic adaptor subunit [Candidatus Magnetomorum sp.]|nr:efflux RND transporter periplasmic adaptor subunit [Candidatus Magnetomorum sp.]
MIKKNNVSKKFVLSISLLLGVFLCSGHSQNSDTVEQRHAFKGVTEPVHEAVLSSPVDGTIKEILVKEGDWVQQSDPVIRLYRREQELEVALRYKIWQNNAAIDAADVEAENVKELFDASKQLFEKNHSVSKEELTRLKIRYDQARFKRIELKIRKEQERIQYEIAKEQLAKRILYAPFQGIVTNVYSQVGERSKSNQQLIKLVNPKVCYFKCNVEERLACNLSPGKKVVLQIQTGTTAVKKTGEVIFVSPVVDPASGLMKVNVMFENKDLSIRPGVSGIMLL